jgi:hypothetical protein
LSRDVSCSGAHTVRKFCSKKKTEKQNPVYLPEISAWSDFTPPTLKLDISYHVLLKPFKLPPYTGLKRF